MVKNYLKVAIRNITRNKLFSAINIIGLSISLASCLLIFIYAADQLSYDKHHQSGVFRLNSISSGGGQTYHLASSCVPMAQGMLDEVPEIENAARVLGSFVFGEKDLITYNGESQYVEYGVVADSSIWDILNYNIIAGSPEKPLPHGNAVVLEHEVAQSIFGSESGLGETLKISTAIGQMEFEVTAIYDGDENKSHLKPSFFISSANPAWSGFLGNFTSQWISNNLVFTYIKLQENANVEQTVQKINEMLVRHGAEEMKSLGFSKEALLQPIEAIHTGSEVVMDIPGRTNIELIQILVGIAILVLLLACVNYINLTTAQASKRALEVGVRKVLGVSISKLIIQFLGESALIVTLSLALSILIAELSLPVFNSLINHPLELTSDVLWSISGYLFLFLVGISIVAGLYPAFYLSSFQPSTVLKGKNSDKGVTASLRKGLVIFQFVISIFLISSILIITEQVDYIKNKDLGFDKDTKVVIPLTTQEARSKYNVLKDKYLSNSRVMQVSGTYAIPGSTGINDLNIRKEGQLPEEGIHIYSNTVDLGYLELLGLDVLAGRLFNSTTSTDSMITQVVINKKGIDELNLTPEEAVGEVLVFDFVGRTLKYEVIGVVSDMHQASLHTKIEPFMYMVQSPENYLYMIMDAELSDFQGLISDLRQDWNELIEGTPFEYQTLNDHLLLQYADDFKTFNLIKYFAAISIVISCLGLYALSMFFAERRFKEIGVRKVLGAQVKDILIMVSKDLSLLIVIAFVLSIPISIYATNQWLETFAYSTRPGIDTYVLAGVISILIGWFTISYQSIKAARTNPTNVLKDE